MNVPNIQQMISWYLYGQEMPPTPSELLTDQWIRYADYPRIPGPTAAETLPAERFGAIIDIDAVEYMTTGPGRFATPDKFALVRKFLTGEGVFNTTNPTLAKVMSTLGVENVATGNYRVRSPISQTNANQQPWSDL
jgi:hypothetical protein